MPEDIILENLRLISASLTLIHNRFKEINTPGDFVSNEHGVLILDAIAMRLQVVGELLKKIDKSDPSFLHADNTVNWRNIMRLRDIVSHHYEKEDPEIIYDICRNHLPLLEKAVNTMIN